MRIDRETPTPEDGPGRRGVRASLWEEARRRAVLGIAGVSGPALLALLELWTRGR
ncbi:hypothetical protein ACPC54_09365 [Kitasatospora sp. NPDC094028]